MGWRFSTELNSFPGCPLNPISAFPFPDPDVFFSLLLKYLALTPPLPAMPVLFSSSRSFSLSNCAFFPSRQGIFDDSGDEAGGAARGSDSEELLDDEEEEEEEEDGDEGAAEEEARRQRMLDAVRACVRVRDRLCNGGAGAGDGDDQIDV
jgi:hypothetical protein